MTNTKNSPSHRILKKGTCQQIAPSSKGQLTYEVGASQDNQQLYIRVTSNSGGGYFSNEWIALDAIQQTIEEQAPEQPFKSLVFKPLYVSRGANNCGFLSAALRKEGILAVVPKAPYSHLAGDIQAFRAAMQNASKAKGKPMQNASKAKSAKAKAKAAPKRPARKKAASVFSD